MESATKETLQRINKEFPTFAWEKDEFEELVNPRLGIITAFVGILKDFEQLKNIDLGDIGID